MKELIKLDALVSMRDMKLRARSPAMCSASCWEKNIFDPRFSEYVSKNTVIFLMFAFNGCHHSKSTMTASDVL